MEEGSSEPMVELGWGGMRVSCSASRGVQSINITHRRRVFHSKPRRFLQIIMIPVQLIGVQRRCTSHEQ
jgi:hypothetical protein